VGLGYRLVGTKHFANRIIDHLVDAWFVDRMSKMGLVPEALEELARRCFLFVTDRAVRPLGIIWIF